jgi:hypothetical protein
LLGAIRAEAAFQAEERRRRDDEQARRHAELAALIPRGVPAQQPGMSAIAVMLAADPDEKEPSVFTQLLDEQLAAGKGS